MSKTITDLHAFLDDLSDKLYHQRSGFKGTLVKEKTLPFLSIEIFSDKTWRISEHPQTTEPQNEISSILLISENMDNPHHDIDVYDLLNISPASLAEKIIEDQSVENIQASEL